VTELLLLPEPLLDTVTQVLKLRLGDVLLETVPLGLLLTLGDRVVEAVAVPLTELLLQATGEEEEQSLIVLLPLLEGAGEEVAYTVLEKKLLRDREAELVPVDESIPEADGLALEPNEGLWLAEPEAERELEGETDWLSVKDSVTLGAEDLELETVAH